MPQLLSSRAQAVDPAFFHFLVLAVVRPTLLLRIPLVVHQHGATLGDGAAAAVVRLLHMPASAAATVPCRRGRPAERRGARAAAGKVARPAPPVRLPEAVSQQLQLELVRGHASVPPPATSGKRSRQMAKSEHVLKRSGRGRDGRSLPPSVASAYVAQAVPSTEFTPESFEAETETLMVARRRRRAGRPVVAPRLGDVAAVESRRPREVAPSKK